MVKNYLKEKIVGCLLGGAVGDALGYPVEFYTSLLIHRKYGAQGIVRYQLAENGVAQISDDTQMSLFTANGLLNAWTRNAGALTLPVCLSALTQAYIDWYDTQFPDFVQTARPTCWLWEVKDLHALRAPGNTCMSALRSLASDSTVRNDSKGCGGIMRVAPIALFAAVHPEDWDGAKVAKLAGEAARLTHLHKLGYLPAALFAYLIYALLPMEQPTGEEVQRLIREGNRVVREVYPGHDEAMDLLMDLLEEAVALAHSGLSDAEAYDVLGQGWTAEETLAIAVYCLLKYEGDFEKAVVAAVNHDGDSDSTGAVAGNLAGAMLGLKAIPEYYKQDLELRSVIEEMGEDLCQTSQHELRTNESRWQQKYMEK